MTQGRHSMLKQVRIDANLDVRIYNRPHVRGGRPVFTAGVGVQWNAMPGTYAFALLCTLFCVKFTTKLTEHRPLKFSVVGIYF